METDIRNNNNNNCRFNTKWNGINADYNWLNECAVQMRALRPYNMQVERSWKKNY